MHITDNEDKQLTNELQTSLIRWYPFRKKSKILLIGEEGAVSLMLRRVFEAQVTCAELGAAESVNDFFDYIICIGNLELSLQPVKVLTRFRGLLAKNGILLLGMNNSLGLRYFCGDYDPYTHRCFTCIDGSSSARDTAGRMYGKGEIEEMLAAAGWERIKFYSVLPRLEEAVFLYADGQLPKEDLGNRLSPSYNNPQTVFLYEETLYDYLARNGLFHNMSNAYLVECSLDGNFADALYVTASIERGKYNATLTIVHSNGTVSKEAAYPEGKERLKRLDDNMRALHKAGVSVVEGHIDNVGRYVMPYIKEATAQVYLTNLLLKDKDKFIAAMDAFRDAILSSSPIHRGKYTDARGNEGYTELFDRAFLDMVPLNSFYINGKFVFFDQEFAEENYPVSVLLTRMIASFYTGSERQKLEKALPSSVLYARYGLLDTHMTWLEMEWAFLDKLKQKVLLTEYNKKVRRDNVLAEANRRRMNYPKRDYRRLFFDIFYDIEGKKLILFGSGKYAREFMNLYRVRYPVYAIVDNNQAVWGQELHNVTIQSPEILNNLPLGEYKVIICVKQFESIMEQLEDMGIEDYSVFDPGKCYAIPRLPIEESPESTKKPYRVGYVAGVFDLFHIGHLNILRRAKEHCDYLIVGVVSDRQVREYKKVEPFVPFNERLDMVRSCKYVNEAHEIPFEHPDTDMAWKLYRFDVQFSGSDYENDPVWLQKKEWLEERGSTMVFFPYTQTTSSTKLKKLIEERLI